MCHPLPPWGGRLKPSPWSSPLRALWPTWCHGSWSMPGHPPRSRRSSPRRRAQVCHTALAWTPRHIRRDRLRRTGHLLISSYILMSSEIIWMCCYDCYFQLAGVVHETACRVTLLEELAKLRWAMEDETSGAALPHLLLDESAWRAGTFWDHPHISSLMKRYETVDSKRM